jgi:hydrogenase-4 component F
LLLLGAIAVAGTPPFGSFLAEWQILSVAADARQIATVVILCVSLAIAFIALAVQFAGVVFGDPPAKKVGAELPAGYSPSSALALTVVPGLLLTASLLLGVLLTSSAFALAEGVGR